MISLRTQLDHYKKVERLWRIKFGKEESKKRISRAVYLISIGSNDYSSPFLTNQSLSVSMSQHVDIVIGNLTTFIHVSSSSSSLLSYKSKTGSFAFIWYGFVTGNIQDWRTEVRVLECAGFGLFSGFTDTKTEERFLLERCFNTGKHT